MHRRWWPISCCAKTGTAATAEVPNGGGGGVPPEAPNEAANEVEESPNEEPKPEPGAKGTEN